MTMWQAVKAAGWPDRILLACAGLAFAVTLIRIGLWLVIAVLGGNWAWSTLVDLVGTLALAYILGSYVYWRQRALKAEEPLPPNQVVVTYPTVGAAAIARMVEESRRAEALSPERTA